MACALGNCYSNRVHTVKSISATSVTFQIGVNSLELPAFSLASPTLVVLPTGERWCQQGLSAGIEAGEELRSRVRRSAWHLPDLRCYQLVREGRGFWVLT